MNLTQGNNGDKKSSTTAVAVDGSGRANGASKISEARREYLRNYYLRNREKAREYQRQYNLRHKKKIRTDRSRFLSQRQTIQEAFTSRDIMHSPTEKALKILTQIVKGERYLVL